MNVADKYHIICQKTFYYILSRGSFNSREVICWFLVFIFSYANNKAFSNFQCIIKAYFAVSNILDHELSMRKKSSRVILDYFEIKQNSRNTVVEICYTPMCQHAQNHMTYL